MEILNVSGVWPNFGKQELIPAVSAECHLPMSTPHLTLMLTLAPPQHYSLGSCWCVLPALQIPLALLDHSTSPASLYLPHPMQITLPHLLPLMSAPTCFALHFLLPDNSDLPLSLHVPNTKFPKALSQP